jgi:hypothetical protein
MFGSADGGGAARNGREVSRSVDGASCTAFDAARGGRVSGVWPRPLKTTTSSLDAEETEAAGDGLRIVIRARSSVSSGEDLGEGGMAGATGASFSSSVPTSMPAETKAMGI